MKILFIGGTGRLSKDVAELALNRGNEVYLLTRGSEARQLFVNMKYKMIYGDIRDIENSKNILQNYKFDVVIDFLTYNIDQLKNTLSIVENKCSQYIFISTATVYKKKDENEIISEEYTEVGNNQWKYAWDKYMCERYLQDYFSGSLSKKYTIIRPYVTYGNTRVPYPIVSFDIQKEWSFIDRILHKQEIPVFDKGNTITTLTHTKDFAKGVVGLFGNEKAYGEAFHITTTTTVTWGQVLDELERILGIHINRLNVTQEDIIKDMPEYKSILIGDKGTNMRFSNKKICDCVPDYVCDISLHDGLQEMITFFKEHKELQKNDYAWQGEIDRFCIKHSKSVKRKYNFNCRSEQLEYLYGRYWLIKIFYKVVKRVWHIVAR